MSTATKAPPTDTGRCGEPTGRRRHRTRGERPCDPCRDAHNARQRQWRAGLIRPQRLSADGARPLSPRSAFGRMAARDVPHPFRPLSRAQCVECFGWYDDPRHLAVAL